MNAMTSVASMVVCGRCRQSFALAFEQVLYGPQKDPGS